MQNPIRLRPAEPERDFRLLAAWFTWLEDQTNTEESLTEYYQKRQSGIIHKVAELAGGDLAGFYWATRDKVEAGRFYLSLFVSPERRGQGIGSRMYADMLQTLEAAGAGQLRVSVKDTCPECRAFAERRGFAERLHQIAMALDLTAFDDRPYDGMIARLKQEGFYFTSMEELGNTEEAQRKLYALNDTASSSTPGVNNEHSWASFEDFQEKVCQSDWYKPGGQLVVIDTTTGAWVAMSAITRFDDHAYNLFTGVDMAYRGRKLAQAVKVLALRYAREVLQVSTVRTHHNTFNQPMIAIDRKLGYVQLPGYYSMEKNLR